MTTTPVDSSQRWQLYALFLSLLNSSWEAVGFKDVVAQVGILWISFIWSAVEEVFGTFTPLEVSLTIVLMFYSSNTAESAPKFSVYSSDSNNSCEMWKQLFSITVLNFGLLSKFLKWFTKSLQRQIYSLGEQIKSYVSLIWSRDITLPDDHFSFPRCSFFIPCPTISSIELWRIDVKQMEKTSSTIALS